MNARQQAILDIKEDLKAQGKCFLAFHRELNPTISQIVKNHIKKQIHKYD